jgi:hypothetical protein
MYKLKNAVKRTSAFVAATGMVLGLVTSMVPAVTFADALNPLTERSLMLSSSSPGYHYLDGSGNSTYAGPGTGNNGQKTGETFGFKVSSNTTDTPVDGDVALDKPIKAWTLQYCTKPAGDCTAPGNYGAQHPTTTSNLDVHYSSPVAGTDFAIRTGGTDWATATPITMTGWNMHTERLADHDAPAYDDPNTTDDDTGNTASTAEKNFIVLANDTSTLQLNSGTKVWIKFFADDDDYITNPGKGAFFVKVNNYSESDYTGADDLFNTGTGANAGKLLPDTDDNIIDGGVTVANVMNDSIWIQTKVLETMYFSVGTTNPDTVSGAHQNCDAITANDAIKMGDTTAEDSLAVQQTYEAKSYWRLSSNSSNGATVYYAGNTLANTNGDKIDPIGGNKIGTVGWTPSYNAAKSKAGGEQFGLAIDTRGYSAPIDGAGIDTGNAPGDGFSANTIFPLVAQTDDSADGDPGNMDYSLGGGTVQNDGGGSAKFAFDDDSLNDPKPIASESTDIVHCATARMRYIANIAPDTPAGVYTSKINYIASPQY